MQRFWEQSIIRGRKVTPKNFCDKDFAALSGELPGAICLKTLVLLESALELFRKFFGAVRAFFWLWGSFLALKITCVFGSVAFSGALWRLPTLS